MSARALDMDGLVAVVTGAASGIGKATAIALGDRGAHVVVTDLPGTEAATGAVVAELLRRGGSAFDISLDVTATATLQDTFDRIAERAGGIHVLVNNAGTQVIKAAIDIEEDDFDRVMSVNLKGAFFCAQAAAMHMVDGRGGSIVNIASQHGVVGNVKRAPYCASKGGLINLTRALAVEWATHGIRVNAVSPTYVSNERNAGLLATDEFALDIERHIPLRRVATPEDVAEGVCYLASPAAGMVTGHNLAVDGGWTAR